MATIYVIDSPTAPGTAVCIKSGSWPGGDGTDNSTIQAALVAAGANGTVIISGGVGGKTYSGTQINTTGGTSFSDSGITLRGALASDDPTSQHTGPVVIDGTGTDANVLRPLGAVFTASNIEVRSKSGRWALYGSVVNGNDLVITGQGRGLRHTGGTINRLRLLGSGNGGSNEYSYQADAGSAIVLNWPIFQDIGTPARANGAAQVTVNNGILSGDCANVYTANVFLLPSTFIGSLIFNNSVVLSSPSESLRTTSVIRNDSTSGGTVTANKCVLQDGVLGGAYIGVTSNDCTKLSPVFKRNRRRGYVTYSFDDNVSLGDCKTLAVDVMGNSVPVTWYMNYSPDNYTTEQAALIVDLIENGHDVGGHSWSHCQIGVIENAFTVISTAPSPLISVTIDQTSQNPAEWSGVLVLKSDGEVVHSASLGVNINIGTIISGINAVSGWTAALVSGATQFISSATLRAKSETSASSSVTIALERNLAGSLPTDRWAYVEIMYHKKVCEEWLSALVGYPYVIKTFAYPGGSYRSGVDDVLVGIAAYYESIGVQPYELARTASVSNGHYLLKSTNIYQSTGPHVTSVVDVAKIAETVGRVCDYLAQAGAAFHLYSHQFSEISAENIKLILDEILENQNISVTSLAEFADLLRTGETADGMTYSVIIADRPDYHLLPASPCIGAGADVGLTTDADGNAVPGAVGYDIGPCSYMPGWTVFDGSMPPLSLSPTAPGDLKQVQAWKRSDVTKEEMP